ncbi:inositol monophosphatase family protein [Bacillus marasmi]|uniref:inositol monophosphatase family protein n=1 Tax=Bacillus marasmi TaxID=1926279 RepID=UPI0011C794CD|nr:inositol monophosphatase family protein [Bacillus marasmi]
MTNWQEIDTYAKQWVKEAGAMIRASFSETLNIQTKSNPNDLVTNIDKATERFFIEKIKTTYPNHTILGEEGLEETPAEFGGIVWIIDPIDGTMNFVHQQRNFAISIGIYEQGIGQIGLIYDVVHNELYHAQKGKGAYLNEISLPLLAEVEVKEAIIGINASWIIENSRIDSHLLAALAQDARATRSLGSAALEIAYVVSGRIDAYISLRLSPWDFAAGKVLIEEVGGVATTLRGDSLKLSGENTVLVSKPGLHRELLEKYLMSGKW